VDSRFFVDTRIRASPGARRLEVGLPETRKGLIIVETGPGKWKTAAALGTRVRRVGQGLKALMVQLERDRGPKRNRVLKFSHWVIESFSHF